MITKADLTDALKPIIKTLNDLEAEQKMISLGQRAQGIELKTMQAEIEQLDKKIEKKLDQQTADIVDFFHQTWISIDKLKVSFDKRLNKLEAHIGLSNS